jgi:Tol biopolymer transport system component
MLRPRPRWGLILAAACLGAIAAVPLTAGATPLPGENGRIVLTSEQNLGAQKAELFLLPVPSSTGGGTLSPPITSSPTLRHRHPTWSPDRTMIAYARGPSAGPFDIWVQDLTQPLSATNPKDLTPNDPASNEDRPAWSPDGTHIAFEKDQGTPASRDIFIASAANGSGQTNITSTDTTIEGKPAWDPSGSTLYYEKGDAQAGNVNVDIEKRSISYPSGMPTAGTEVLAVVDDGGKPEIQPAISPNGDKICYGTGYPASATHDIKVAALTGSPASGSVVSMNAFSYYCTWSPDNTMVAYTAGAGSAGDLVMVRADGTSLFEIPLATGANIQTNPDWAPDARPECPDSTVTTAPNVPVTFQVVCNDTGPAYEQTDVLEFNDTKPTNGTLTQNLAGDPFTYTPNQGFVGTDSFQVKSFDALGFGSDTGTVTITVATAKVGTPCIGKTPTVVGTPGADQLAGTAGRDIVDAQGGKDTVNALGGNDVVCGGPGKDTLKGGPGKDTLLGQGGKDKLKGGGGKDTCKGGGGKDAAATCEVKKSI